MIDPDGPSAWRPPGKYDHLWVFAGWAIMAIVLCVFLWGVMDNITYGG